MATPHAPIGGVGLAHDEAAGFELVDDGADRGPADAEPVRQLGLGGRTEFGDVAEQAGLRQVEGEWLQRESNAVRTSRAVAISVDSTRNHGGESSSWVVRF